MFSFLTMLILFILMNIFLSMNHFNFNIKIFECGFENFYWCKAKMNIHFFKIGLIFIIFDLELLYLFFLYKEFKLMSFIVMLFIFSTIWLEMLMKSYQWSN